MAKKRKFDDVTFTTKSGRKIILIYEDTEYRAYDITGSVKKELRLGSTSYENLKNYVMERW